ncbi:MAG: hypothetical protein ABI782_00250 [Anaerolineaceae bacterium]
MRRWFVRLFLLLTVFSVFVIAEEATPANAAATRAWTGAVDLKWSTPGNWNPVGAPVNGDSVFFLASASGKTVTNDLVNLNLASVFIDPAMTITGNTLGISTAVIFYGTGVIWMDLPLTLGNDVQISVQDGGQIELRKSQPGVGQLALNTNGHTLTFPGEGVAILNGDLIGGGEIHVNSGTLNFAAPVSYTGTIFGGPDASFQIFQEVPFDPTSGCSSARNTRFVLSGSSFGIYCAASVASFAGEGLVSLYGGSSLTLTGTPGASFNGEFTGAANRSIFCCGTGVQTLTGTSAFSGNVVVSGGMLAFDGATFPSTSKFTVTNGTLAGYGSFGDTTMTGGALLLGPVNGRFGLAKFVAIQFAPEVHVRFVIEGAEAGLNFTQMVMSDQTVLDSAVLELDFGGYSPPNGQAITLVKGAPSLFGTFKGLPEGANFTVGSLKFKITYKGGSGHDVIITSLGSNATPTATPTPVPGARPFKRYVPMVAVDR